MKAIPNNPKGFTLVEMLMAMAAGLIVMTAIYSAYVNHQRSHVTQQLRGKESVAFGLPKELRAELFSQAVWLAI